MTLLRVVMSLFGAALLVATFPAYQLVWARGWRAYDVLLVISSACFALTILLPWVIL